MRRWCPVEVRNTLNLFDKPLAKLPAMFGLDEVQKEVMCYPLYNAETIERRYIPLAECRKYCEDDWVDADAFEANARDWGYVDAHERVDIIAYSRKYCEADCKVLKAAYYKFKELIATVCTYDCEDDEDNDKRLTGSLDLDAYYTINTLTDHFYTVDVGGDALQVVL